MSLLLIAFHPRMDEPSNPEPSLNRSSVNSLAGIVKCCHVPIRSTNFRSTTCTLFFFANSNASRTFIPSSFQTSESPRPPALRRFDFEKFFNRLLDARPHPLQLHVVAHFGP